MEDKAASPTRPNEDDMISKPKPKTGKIKCRFCGTEGEMVISYDAPQLAFGWTISTATVICPQCNKVFAERQARPLPMDEDEEPTSEGMPNCPNCGCTVGDEDICPECGSPNFDPMGDDLRTVQRALSSIGDQGAIARIGLDALATVLRKNLDYGSSVFDSPCLVPGMRPGTSIAVRLSDKIKRIGSLMDGHEPRVKESLGDTVKDVCGYAILWLVSMDKDDVKG